MEEGGLAVSLVKEKVRGVERIWEKREKVKVEGCVKMRLGLGLNEVGVGLKRVISEVMSCQ